MANTPLSIPSGAARGNRTPALITPPTDSPCWVWPFATDSDGYGIAHVNGHTKRAHRAIWESLYGPIPADKKLLHTCDNPPCCNIRHLYIGTDADNAADRVARLRLARGMGHGRSKLTDEDVRAIRHDLELGKTVTEVAQTFSVDRKNIRAIRDGQTWAWLS